MIIEALAAATVVMNRWTERLRTITARIRRRSEAYRANLKKYATEELERDPDASVDEVMNRASDRLYRDIERLEDESKI